jgi:hypothetical protein
MPRPLDTRLDRVEGKRVAVAAELGSAATRRRRLWRAEAAIGQVIRDALARAGVDAAGATRLCLADQAAAFLAALPDTPQLRRANGNAAAAAAVADGDRALGDAFAPKILAMIRGFASQPPPDFANASFAELFAWSLAQPAAE